MPIGSSLQTAPVGLGGWRDSNGRDCNGHKIGGEQEDEDAADEELQLAVVPPPPVCLQRFELATVLAGGLTWWSGDAPADDLGPDEGQDQADKTEALLRRAAQHQARRRPVTVAGNEHAGWIGT